MTDPISVYSLHFDFSKHVGEIPSTLINLLYCKAEYSSKQRKSINRRIELDLIILRSCRNFFLNSLNK